MGAYLRKLVRCKCGNELGLFGRSCEECKSKQVIKKIRTNSLARQGIFSTSNKCAKCLKSLSGKIVEYSTGRMHYKCWFNLL